MDNSDVKNLVEAFKGYRDLLAPVQNSLYEFAQTYEMLKGDIERLNGAFGSDAKESLQKIYNTLSAQAEKASDLSSRIERFTASAGKYAAAVDNLVTAVTKVENKLSAVNEIENRAEEQLGKLDALLEEKKKSYNVRDLQKTLETYDNNVNKISEFINKDVADTIADNNRTLTMIKEGNDALQRTLFEQGATTRSLLEQYSSSVELLKRISEKEDVNEEYIFDILDKWAADRKVKIKK